MRWKGAAIWGLRLTALVALFVLVLALTLCVVLRSDRRASMVPVPDWTGRSREEALADAARVGLVFEVGEQRHDPGVAADRIIQQDPPAGSQVRQGRTIRVVVSLGGETLTVPELGGHPARQAELELRRAGLAPGWESLVHDDSAPVGQVLAQSPAAGTLSVSGDRVHRLVSEGPRPPRWVMPDLTGRTLREAQDWITLCGFRGGAVRHVPADGRQSGTVVGQLPLSGYAIGRRDVVELTVAD
jgi:serine/threonine-protein kinase